MTNSLRGMLIIGLLVLSGCGGSDVTPTTSTTTVATTTTVPATVTVRAVAVTGVPASLGVTQTAQLTATATLTDNSTQNVTGSATWASSNDVVATVGSAGLLTARGLGVADISATYQGVAGRASVTVSAAMLRPVIVGDDNILHNTPVTYRGDSSTSSPFPIAFYRWTCGQTINPANTTCMQTGPSPTFNYRKCENSAAPFRPPCNAGSSDTRTYTISLEIEDTAGNKNTATKNVTVRNSY